LLWERGRGVVVFHCPFQNNYTNILTNFNTFQKTYYMLTSNYYKVDSIQRINTTTLLKNITGLKESFPERVGGGEKGE
jgi:hypothetical protein